MNINEIYTTCNYISNKHKSGSAFTPTQFNALIKMLNRDFFKKKAEESGYFDNRTGMSYNDALKTSKNLRVFIHNETLAVGAATTYTFAYFLGGTNTANNVPIELVDEAEYNDRMGVSVLLPAIDCPVAMERGDTLVIKPDTVVNINLSYYRYPNDPFLDYYLDVNGVIQFLGAGVVHVWATGEIDSTGTARVLGQPNWTSLTVELEYNKDFHDDFMNEILSRVGIRLNRPELTQYVEAMKAQDKQM